MGRGAEGSGASVLSLRSRAESSRKSIQVSQDANITTITHVLAVNNDEIIHRDKHSARETWLTTADRSVLVKREWFHAGSHCKGEHGFEIEIHHEDGSVTVKHLDEASPEDYDNPFFSRRMKDGIILMNLYHWPCEASPPAGLPSETTYYPDGTLKTEKWYRRRPEPNSNTQFHRPLADGPAVTVYFPGGGEIVKMRTYFEYGEKRRSEHFDRQGNVIKEWPDRKNKHTSSV